MNEIIVTAYNPFYVALSFFCAFMGAYTALACVYKLLAYQRAHISHRLDQLTGKRTQPAAVPTPKMYFATLLVAGIAFGGLGVWSMHFIGTLALRMPIAVDYSIGITLLSLLAAVAAATWGLGIVAENPYSKTRLVLGGAILGLGVSAMHYLGMYSMNFDGFFLWNLGTVALSCLIAFVAATAALWMAFAAASNYARLFAAALMGVAVCAMHYTGMAAADVVCTTSTPLLPLNSARAISVPQLPVLLVMLIVVITFIVAVNRMYSRQFKS